MSLLDNLQTEKVSRLSLRNPILIPAGTKVSQAIDLMRSSNLGCVVVVDSEEKATGLFTESMLAEMVAHHSFNPNDPIDDHAADRFPWVRETDPISFVIEAMEVKNVRLMCVLDERDRAVGVTGQRGIMEYVAEYFPGDVTVQRIGMPDYSAEREGA